MFPVQRNLQMFLKLDLMHRVVIHIVCVWCSSVLLMARSLWQNVYRDEGEPDEVWSGIAGRPWRPEDGRVLLLTALR